MGTTPRLVAKADQILVPTTTPREMPNTTAMTAIVTAWHAYRDHDLGPDKAQRLQ